MRVVTGVTGVPRKACTARAGPSTCRAPHGVYYWHIVHHLSAEVSAENCW